MVFCVQAPSKMEVLVTVAMITGRLIADENEQAGVCTTSITTCMYFGFMIFCIRFQAVYLMDLVLLHSASSRQVGSLGLFFCFFPNKLFRSPLAGERIT